MPPKKETVTKKPAAPAAPAAGTKRPAAGETTTLPSRTRGGDSSASGSGSAAGDPPRPGSAHSSASNASRPASSGGTDLNHFSYYVSDPDGKFASPIASDSVEFRLMADAYHIGLQRFKHPNTQKELIIFGTQCVESWTAPVNKIKYGDYKWGGVKSQMSKYLENFIKGVVHTSPLIVKYTANPTKTVYASTWLEKTYAGSLDSVLDTRKLFHFRIPDVFPEHLVDAYDKHEDDRYQELRTTVAVSFFHELVHGWVFFLIGSVTAESLKVGTPPEYRAPWDEVDELALDMGKGESGFYIESLIFGATLGLSPHPKPLATKQKQPELVGEDEWQRVKVIPADVAKAFNKDPKGYDIKSRLKEVFGPRPRKSSGSDEQPAKRRKIAHVNLSPGKNDRNQAWHIKFIYNSDHSSATSLTKIAAA